MPPFIKREASAGPASGERNINKPSRRVTKDDISGPTLLPHGGSQSLPISTSTLKDAMKGHKRGQSEPFPAGWRGWASFFGGLRSPDIKKLVISSASNSNETADSIFSRQMGPQSIQIIFPQVNKNKSLPAIPPLGPFTLRAAELPDVTNSIHNSTTSLGNEPDPILSPIVCPTMEHLVGQDEADYVHTQYVALKENEEVEDMYAKTMSFFEGLSLDSDQRLGPTWDDKSMARPTSVSTAKSTTYSLIIGEDSTAYDTAPEGGDPETISVPYIPPDGTFLARFSQDLDDAHIPYTIRKAERSITSPGLPEKDGKLEAVDQGSVPDARGDVILQVYRHGLDDLEEELLAREIIFTRGSDYFHRRHSQQNSEEGAQALLRRRTGHRFPTWYQASQHEGSEDTMDEGSEYTMDSLLNRVQQALDNIDAYDSDGGRPPSEY